MRSGIGILTALGILFAIVGPELWYPGQIVSLTWDSLAQWHPALRLTLVIIEIASALTAVVIFAKTAPSVFSLCIGLYFSACHFAAAQHLWHVDMVWSAFVAVVAFIVPYAALKIFGK